MTESSEMAAELALEASDAGKGHPNWRNGVAFTTLVIAGAGGNSRLVGWSHVS